MDYLSRDVSPAQKKQAESPSDSDHTQAAITPAPPVLADPVQRKEEEEEATQLKAGESEGPEKEGLVGGIQRKAEEEEATQLKSAEEEETTQQKSAGAISPPEFSMDTTSGGMLQRKASEEEESLQAKTNFGESVQLKGEEEEESLQMKKGPSSEGGFSPSSGGGGLPGEVQNKMESSFNTDFSNVNIHENSQSATDVGALAYAQGNDVHFAPGQYNPSSQQGQELIGHELAHVVQQRQGRVKPTTQAKSGMPVNDSATLETEADVKGREAARGQNTGMNSSGAAGGGGIQMKALPPSTFLPGAGEPVQKKGEEEEESMQAKASSFGLQVASGAEMPGSQGQGYTSQMKMGNAVPFQLKADGTMQRTEEEAPAQNAAMPGTVVDISNGFNPSADIASYLNENDGNYVQVRARMGGLASGTISVKQSSPASEDGTSAASYQIESGQYLTLLMANGFLSPLAAQGIIPVIALNASDPQNITGFLSFKLGETVVQDPRALIQNVNNNLEALGLGGISPIEVPEYTNEVVGGVLTLMAPTLSTEVGGFMNASGTFGLVDDTFVFSVEADVDIGGLGHGMLSIERNDEGQYYGEADLDVTVKNLSGNVKVVYANGSITGRGTANMEAEKFSGSLTMIFDEEAIANAAVHEGLGIESMGGEEGEAPVEGAASNKVLAGFGSVTVHLTDWLTATANVGVDSHGHVTVHGSLTFPDEIELMEQQDKKKDLFDAEIKAGYGIPLVGQVFLFANIGMFVQSGFGPLALRNIGMEGTYSTDPNVLQNFKITGSLGISAYAKVGLQVQAGVGLTLLGHDVKAGIDLDAMAGVQAYAEATPTFEYAERDADGQKVGDAFLKGHFEAAARLFLELAGAFFVEVDAPWWSPCPDKTWEWPFANAVYPLGNNFGVGADVDWLVGSPNVPELEFSPVEFDPDKFISDMTADPDNFGESGNGGDQDQAGQWADAGGGNMNQEPEAAGPGGAGEIRRPEIDPATLSDEEKYMKALDELGKLAEDCNKNPVPDGSLRKRVEKIKNKYMIDQITLRDRQPASLQLYVRHKSQNNRNNTIQVKVITAAERDRQFRNAVADLDTSLDALGDPQTKSVTRSQAQTAAREVDHAHEVIVDTRVSDQGQDWVIFGDIEETDRKMTKRPQAEKQGLEDEPEGQEAQGTDDDVVRSESDVTDADRTNHRRWADEMLAEMDETGTESTVGKVETYEILKAKAADLKRKYQRKLRNGINLNITLDQLQGERDNDVTTEVAIVPNTTKKVRKISLADEKIVTDRAAERGIDLLDGRAIDDRHGTGDTAEALVMDRETEGSMAKKPEYEAFAEAWEDKFGGLASRDKRAKAVAKACSDWCIEYLERKHGDFEAENADLKRDILRAGIKEKGWSGAVGKVVGRIKNVLKNGSVGSRLAHFDNFYRGVFLQDMLEVDQRETHLDYLDTMADSETREQRNQIDRTVNAGGPAHVKPYSRNNMTGKSTDQWHMRDESQTLGDSKAKQSTRKLGEVESSTGMEISDDEKTHMRLNNGNYTMKWEEGNKRWSLNERDKWVFAMRQLSLPLKAGVSGSTANLMLDMSAINVPHSGVDRRLACIAYLLPTHHHSLVEIMMGASGKGGAPAFRPSQKFYHNILPYTKSQLAAKLGDFPDESYAKAKAAGKKTV